MNRIIHALSLNAILLLVALVSLHTIPLQAQQISAQSLPDLALQPARVITNIGPEYFMSARGSQGVPAIERATQGRLWAAWYASKSKRGVESPSSYVVLATSGDDGATWTEKLVLQTPRLCQTYDPCLWIDPVGRLWFFWAQSAGLQDGRMGVWSMTTADAGLENPTWWAPRRISNGVMLNKPTVLKNGTWLLLVGYPLASPPERPLRLISIIRARFALGHNDLNHLFLAVDGQKFDASVTSTGASTHRQRFDDSRDMLHRSP